MRNEWWEKIQNGALFAFERNLRFSEKIFELSMIEFITTRNQIVELSYL